MTDNEKQDAAAALQKLVDSIRVERDLVTALLVMAHAYGWPVRDLLKGPTKFLKTAKGGTAQDAAFLKAYADRMSEILASCEVKEQPA